MSDTSSADFLHLIQVELARLGSIPAETLGTPLPHIDGWKVHDVVGHTGWICRWVDLCLKADPAAPPARSNVAEPPVGVDVLEWFDEGRRIVNDTLASADRDALRPTWTGPQPARWWMRRPPV